MPNVTDESRCYAPTTTAGRRLRRTAALVAALSLGAATLAVGVSAPSAATAATVVTELVSIPGGCCVEVTDDGRHVVMTTTESGLVAVDTATGVRTPLVPAGGLGVWNWVELAEGSTPQALYIGADGALRSVPVTGGSPTRLSPVPPAGRGVVFFGSDVPIVNAPGTHVAFKYLPAGFGPAALYLVPVHGPAPAQPITASEGGPGSPIRFTADGSRLAFLESLTNGLGTLSVVGVDGGAPVPLASPVGRFAVGAGDRAVYSTWVPGTGGAPVPSPSTVRSVRFDGSNDLVLATGMPVGVQPHLSPDGTTTVVPDISKVWAVPTAGGPPRKIIDDSTGIISEPMFTADSTHVVVTLSTGPFANAPGKVIAARLDGSGSRILTDVPRTVLGISLDSSSVVLAATSGSTHAVTRVPMAGGPAVDVVTYTAAQPLDRPVLDSSRSSVVFVASAAGQRVLQRALVSGPAAPATIGPISGTLIATSLRMHGEQVVYADSVSTCLNAACLTSSVVRLVAPPFTPPAPPPAPPTDPPVAPGPGVAPAAPVPVLQPTPAPERLLDTRLGIGAAVGRLGERSVTQLQITGRGGVPEGANAVALNVTVVGAAADGYLTVWPCGAGQPTASHLNYRAEQTVANMVISKIGEAGRVCIYADGATDVLADVSAWFAGSSPYVPVVPERILETRPGAGPVNHVGGKPAAGDVLRLKVTRFGAADLPDSASAVVLNITGVDATEAGYVTVWPCGQDMPTSSSLNLLAGETRPNLVVSQVGAGGEVCIFTERGTHLLADLAGWFPA